MLLDLFFFHDYTKMHGPDYFPAKSRTCKLDTPQLCILTQNSAMFVIPRKKLPKVEKWSFFCMEDPVTLLVRFTGNLARLVFVLGSEMCGRRTRPHADSHPHIVYDPRSDSGRKVFQPLRSRTDADWCSPLTVINIKQPH